MYGSSGKKSLRKMCGIGPYLRHWADLRKERGTCVLFLLVHHQGNQKSPVWNLIIASFGFFPQTSLRTGAFSNFPFPPFLSHLTLGINTVPLPIRIKYWELNNGTESWIDNERRNWEIKVGEWPGQPVESFQYLAVETGISWWQSENPLGTRLSETGQSWREG